MENAPEWFQDAKFGIYFHWGAFTTPEYGDEWYGNRLGNNSSFRSHHESVYGDIGEWPYHNFIIGAEDKEGNWVQFAPKLKSEGGEFDPEEWAQLFADAGAKFAGPVMEHHDGFSMWDSDVTPWNSVDLGPQLDLAGLFVDAIRGKGMKVLSAMHHAYNLSGEFFYWVDDYEPWKKTVEGMSEDDIKKLYGKFDSEEERDAFWLDKLKEIIDKYDPDIIWQDFHLDRIGEDARLQFLSYFYNKNEEENGDGVVATYKYNYEYNDGFTEKSAVPDYERGGAGGIKDFYWLTDDTVGPDSWSYTKGMKYYSAKSLIYRLVDCVSKNGNLLLNISPRADGSIPQEQKDILLTIGDWLEKYGEAIYSTRAWSVYGEGPTVMGGGVFTSPKEGTESDIRFTRSKDETTLYAIGLQWPEDGVMDIRTLKNGILDTEEIQGIYMADGSGMSCKLQYEQDNQGLHITLPEKTDKADDNGYAVKLVFESKIPDVQGITFYQDENYQGAAVTLMPGEYDQKALEEAGVSIDGISSVQIPKGYAVYAYDGGNFDGICWNFEKSLSKFGGANDAMASVKIVKNPEVLEEVVPEEGKIYKIVLRNNPDYVLEYEGEAANSSNVQIGLKTEEAENQKWLLIPVEGEDGYYRISPASNENVCIDINWSNYHNGENLLLYEYGDGADNRRWKLESTGSGYYAIQSKGNSSYCIDESEVEPYAGANVQLWEYEFGDRQQWRLEEVVKETEKEQTKLPVFENTLAIAESANENRAVFRISGSTDGVQYKVYTSETGETEALDVTVSVEGQELALQFDTERKEEQIFYISATENGKTESDRIPVIIVPYLSSYNILKAALDTVQLLDNSWFTAESYEALEQVKKEAIAAYEAGNLTAEDAESYVNRLKQAVADLKVMDDQEYQETLRQLEESQKKVQELENGQKKDQEAIKKVQEEMRKLQEENRALKESLLPKKGDTEKANGVVYRIIDVQNKQVEAYRPVNKNAKSIRVPDKISIEGQSYSVTAISDQAFASMKKLTKIVIGENVVSIGKKAFYHDTKLKSIVIKSQKLKVVGKAALKGISGKAVITIPGARKKEYTKLLKKKGQKKTVKIK